MIPNLNVSKQQTEKFVNLLFIHVRFSPRKTHTALNQFSLPRRFVDVCVFVVDEVIAMHSYMGAAKGAIRHWQQPRKNMRAAVNSVAPVGDIWIFLSYIVVQCCSREVLHTHLLGKTRTWLQRHTFFNCPYILNYWTHTCTPDIYRCHHTT